MKLLKLILMLIGCVGFFYLGGYAIQTANSSTSGYVAFMQGFFGLLTVIAGTVFALCISYYASERKL